MWTTISHFILKNKIALVLGLVAYTAFMGWYAKDVRLSHNFVQVVPSSDPDLQYFREFKKTFGSDANLFVVGIRDSSLFEVENFNRFAFFSNEVAQMEGINEVLSLPRLVLLKNNRLQKTFRTEKIFKKLPDDQHTLDSLLKIAFTTKIYQDRLYNDSSRAVAMLISINPKVLNSAERNPMMEEILTKGQQFTEHTGVELHYAGLPYLRTKMSGKVAEQMKSLTGFSLLATALILLLFFRSFSALLFPFVVIIVVVISSVGTISLLGYEITLLTGLIPPIIVVISVPNCVYLLNKYHREYARHGNKTRAVSYIVRKIGIVTLMTNATTAIGFIVLAFAEIPILSEFGIVSGFNILIAFVTTIILLPSLFLWLPDPKERHIRHVDSKFVTGFTGLLQRLVSKRRLQIYIATVLVVLVSAYGFSKLKVLTFMVDDLPKDSRIKQDLAFFEKHFTGAMPLELVVNTGKPGGAKDINKLRTISALSDSISGLPYVSQPVSMVEYIKAARQAFYRGNPSKYGFPSSFDRSMIFMYLRRQARTDSSSMGQDMLSSFTDSTGQYVRVSFKVKDVGSNKVEAMVGNRIRPAIDSVLADTKMSARLTGTTLLFIKGNHYLVRNLEVSLLVAMLIIAGIMGILFGNFKMILLSLLPNTIPLLITAGMMGFFGIPIKPSTALIFTIALGISVDDSIHFLAKYRQELKLVNYHIPSAVKIGLKETAPSMMYTSIVLFSGFIIFAFSDFGGTVALGILTSTTLFFAMVTNLVFLPSLLMSYDKSSSERAQKSHLIDSYDEYHNQPDEEDESEIEVSEEDASDSSLDK